MNDEAVDPNPTDPSAEAIGELGVQEGGLIAGTAGDDAAADPGRRARLDPGRDRLVVIWARLLPAGFDVPVLAEPLQPRPADGRDRHDRPRHRPGPAARRDRSLGRLGQRRDQRDPRGAQHQPRDPRGAGDPDRAPRRPRDRSAPRALLHPHRSAHLRRHPGGPDRLAGAAAGGARRCGHAQLHLRWWGRAARQHLLRRFDRLRGGDRDRRRLRRIRPARDATPAGRRPRRTIGANDCAPHRLCSHSRWCSWRR